MRSTSRAALALFAVLALAGCSENPYAPDLGPEGEARFSYSGTRSGEFVASGRINRRNPNAGAWAIGATAQENGAQVLGVLAQQRRADLLADAIIIEWAGAQVGTVTCTAATETCPFSAVFIMGTQPMSSTVEAEYTGDEGTVTVTSLTEDRARGTFSLTLRQSTGTNVQTIQASGSFDVPLNVID